MNRQNFILLVMVALSACLPQSFQSLHAGTLNPDSYYTWGIHSEALSIDPGNIVTDAVLTIHDIANWDDNMYVHLLDNPPLGFKAGTDIENGDYFISMGVLLNMTYQDPDLVCRFGDFNDPNSWVWDVFNPNTTSQTSLVLELIDYAGTGTSFGLGFDPDGLSNYDFDKITLDLTVDSFTGPVTRESMLFQTDGTPGLVGHWTMDDDAANTTILDSSGNANNGVSQQDTSALSAAGRIDGALSFNGIDDHIEVPFHENLNITGSLTLSAWIKPAGGGTYEYIVSRWQGPYSYMLFTGHNKAGFYVEAGGNNANATFETELNDGQWYHLVGTWDGSQATIYVDATATAGTLGQGDVTTSGNGLIIGSRTGSDYFFTGSLDDVRVYDRALSATDVGDLYDEGQDLTAPNPDPMTWSTVPYATSSSSISMTATTASDVSDVEYYFTCTSGGGNDSGWQDNPAYVDMRLSPDTQYTYRVQARDKSPNQNATALSNSLSATTAPASDGLVSHWTFDDDASGIAVVDGSGNGHNGTAQQNTEVLHTTGRIDGALSFNGIDDHIEVPFHENLNITGSLTLSAWIKPAGGGTYEYIVSRWQGPYSYMLFTGHNKAGFYVEAGGNNANATFETELNDGQWYHLVGTWDGSQATIYVDATATAGTLGQGDVTTSGNGLIIGSRTGSDYFFTGSLDDVRVYDKALSTTEVGDLYNEGGT